MHATNADGNSQGGFKIINGIQLSAIGGDHLFAHQQTHTDLPGFQQPDGTGLSLQ